MKRQRLRVRYLWYTVCVTVFVVACMEGAYLLLRNTEENFRALKVRWDGEELRLYAPSDGPFVVTHLARYSDTEVDKAVAALPEPIAIIDSAGARIGPETLKHLVWRSAINRQVVAGPRSGEPIWALYYRPQLTPQRTARF